MAMSAPLPDTHLINSPRMSPMSRSSTFSPTHSRDEPTMAWRCASRSGTVTTSTPNRTQRINKAISHLVQPLLRLGSGCVLATAGAGSFHDGGTGGAGLCLGGSAGRAAALWRSYSKRCNRVVRAGTSPACFQSVIPSVHTSVSGVIPISANCSMLNGPRCWSSIYR